ncbi:MAG: hypothetical protein ACLQMH_11555 [Solirubrobacteraceae bacterium]
MADHPGTHGETVLGRVRELPGGAELLELAAGRDDVELVGGAVRDLLLGRTPRELDVVVSDDAPALAGALALSLGLPREPPPGGRSGTIVHERFGTALLWWPQGRVDVACRRAESYSEPGALPDVRPGTAEEDLRRRDFTVNAIAVSLGGRGKGTMRTVPHALEDLAAARLRVLHEESFLDDPTRLLRLARYLARLGFEPEEHTAALAAEALAGGALQTVSGARIGTELRLALTEPEPVAAVGRLRDLGVLCALHPRLHLDEGLTRASLALLPEEGRADLLLLAALLLAMTEAPGEDPEPAIVGLLDRLQFPAGDRDRVLATVLVGPALPARMDAALTPSQLRRAVRSAPLEAVALASALAEQQHLEGAAAGARRWLSELRHVRLQITGADLLAAGIPAGPEIGRRLELALGRKLDGELSDGRDAEMSAAVEGR